MHLKTFTAAAATVAAVALSACAPPMEEEKPAVSEPTPEPTQLPVSTEVSPEFAKVIAAMEKLASDVGGTLGESFDAGGNITGHVVTISEHDIRIAYSTADGSRIILGTIIDADGENLTAAHIEERTPKVDLEGPFSELEKLALATLTTGKTPSTMRVIYDPLCGFCKELYRTMADNDIQVHWHPVAIMGPEAVSISAGMISKRDTPEEVMTQAQSQSGQTELSAIGLDNDAARTAVDLNWAIASKTRVDGTPVVYWKDQDGTVKMVRGRPSAEDLAMIIEQSKIN